MAILFSDGFDYNSPDVSAKYTSFDGSSVTSITARTGSAWQWVSGFANYTLAANESTLYVGFAFQDSSSAANKTILKIIDGSTTQVELYVNTSRQVVLKNGNGTTLNTSTTTVSGSTWTYIELKVVIADSGSYQLKMNNNSEFSTTGDTKNSANAYATKVSLGNDSASSAGFDDYYIDDANFLGTVKIYTINPTSDSSVAFTPSAGSNYQCVDDGSTGHDGDTTYVSATASGTKDLYGFADLALTAGTIKGVSLNFVAKKTDSNPASLIPTVKMGGTEYQTTAKTLTTSYVNYQTVYETNPNTSSAWTYANVDAIIAGYEAS
jgi:hypothetical protein